MPGWAYVLLVDQASTSCSTAAAAILWWPVGLGWTWSFDQSAGSVRIW